MLYEVHVGTSGVLVGVGSGGVLVGVGSGVGVGVGVGQAWQPPADCKKLSLPWWNTVLHWSSTHK
jgi:hypothetical protein